MMSTSSKPVRTDQLRASAGFQSHADTQPLLSEVAADLATIANRFNLLVHQGSVQAQQDLECNTTLEAGGLVELLRSCVSARHFRNSIFPSGLFADPAWDMLLNLYLSHCEGRPVSISNLGSASGVPTTTAWRWQSLLEEKGLTCRIRDIRDARRIFIQLTPAAITAMHNWLRKMGDQIAHAA